MSLDPRRLLLRVAQTLFIVAVFVYGGREIASQWAEAEGRLAGVELQWLPLLAATLLVFAVYFLLVQLWRGVLRLWNAPLGLYDAVHIWSVSNLGRFVPGRVAAIGAMAMMARERGVSPVAATGSSLLNAMLNIAAGVAIALATGGHQLAAAVGADVRAATLLVVAAIAGLLLLPWLIPALTRLASRLSKRGLTLPAVPAGVIWRTAAGNAVAWLVYGVAFQLFTAGSLGGAAGATTAYIAVYTGSYVVGYLSLLTPGGLGVREGVMVALLQAFGLAQGPEAWVLAFASRIWLTVLEVVPGLLFLAFGLVRPRPPLTSGDASP